MATLVLGVVGRAVLGPLGGVVGSLLGSGLDRRLFGGGRSRSAAAAPEIQSASYGEPLAIVHGRMRVSGNIIWAAPVRSFASRAGGKRGSNDSQSYSASFAVALCSRRVSDVGRIWADGRLIRDSNGNWLKTITMRLHHGTEYQSPDFLIAAAENAAPAYRGMAYVVFEDMPLDDYGNRIPSLSFEVIADDGQVTMADVAQSVATRVGLDLKFEGLFPEVTGMVVATTSAASDALAPILRSAGAMISAGTVMIGRTGIRKDLGFPLQADAVRSGGSASRERLQRAAVGASPVAIEVGYYDVSRDYQPGLQRARIRAGMSVETDALPAALTPDLAKRLVQDRLLDAQAGRQRMVLRLPWRHLGIRPGERLEYDGSAWQVREVRFEAFVLILELVQTPHRLPALTESDGGRALDHGDRASGPTTIVALDLPPLPGELPTQPRLLVAAGADESWRGCSVEISLDNGVSFEPVGTLSRPVAMGVALNALAEASPAVWDRRNQIEIEVISDAMWLESRPEPSVLSGANLALLGSEIIQFQTATPIGGRRFALSGLLRGRRGTEASVGSHAIGDRFLLLNTNDMLPLQMPLEHLGTSAIVRAMGPGDLDWVVVDVRIGDLAIQPLAPVHLSIRRQGDEFRLNWIASSRAGFGWPDLGDVPTGENRAEWRVIVRNHTSILTEGTVMRPEFTCPAFPQPFWFDVAQIGQTVGQSATLRVP